eukprot:scaffold12275_cov19-Tisochrysis_lutea.AAC.1
MYHDCSVLAELSLLLTDPRKAWRAADSHCLPDYLCRDLLAIEEIKSYGIAFLVIEMVTISSGIFWCWLLLKVGRV